MTIEEAREGIGRNVLYRPYGAARPEEGVITRVGDGVAFVLYRGDFAPKATFPRDLSFTWEEE